MRPASGDHRARRREQYLEVQPERLVLGIADVEPDHLVERRAAAAGDLPQPRDAWLGFQHSTKVPRFVAVHLVRKRRAWADERHLALEDVPELRQLVETGAAQ